MNDIMLPKGILELSRIFSVQGYTLFLVGGYVRNHVLGISGGDFDVCSSARPEDAAAFLRNAGLTVIEKALALGTIEAHLIVDEIKYVFEHTTFRRDYYPQGGDHRPYKVEFTTDMTEDARRRDFTINALYLNIETKSIIDPINKGLMDIKNNIIRAAADNPDETIRDDGLRIMRMARFAAELGFDVCPQLMACAGQRASMLSDISPERKRDELKKILMSDTKYPALTTKEPQPKIGLQLLWQTGALLHILPILCEGDGVTQSKKYHQHDVLGHGIQTCAVSLPIPELRLAALFHDIGKPKALRQSGNMHGHEVLGEALARDELNALKFDNKTKSIVLPLIKNHMFDLEGKAKPKTIRKRAIMLGKQGFTLLIALRSADFLGSGKSTGCVVSVDNWQRELDRMIVNGVPWSIQELAITGNDIINVLKIKPSPKIGMILNVLFHECVAKPGMNHTEILKQRAKKMLQGDSILP